MVHHGCVTRGGGTGGALQLANCVGACPANASKCLPSNCVCPPVVFAIVWTFVSIVIGNRFEL